MCLRVDAGRPIAHVAAEAGISRRCLAKWYARWLTHGEDGLTDRSSQPIARPNRTSEHIADLVEALRRQTKYGPARLAAELEKLHGITVAPATVHRVLVRRGLSRLRDLDPPTGEQLRGVVRYEHDRVGDLVHVDVKKLGGRGLRTAHGWSQARLADEFNTSHGTTLTREYIARWERGKVAPGGFYLAALWQMRRTFLTDVASTAIAPVVASDLLARGFAARLTGGPDAQEWEAKLAAYGSDYMSMGAADIQRRVSGELVVIQQQLDAPRLWSAAARLMTTEIGQSCRGPRGGRRRRCGGAVRSGRCV